MYAIENVCNADGEVEIIQINLFFVESLIEGNYATMSNGSTLHYTSVRMASGMMLRMTTGVEELKRRLRTQ